MPIAADLSGVDGFVGSVQGVLDAIESDEYQGNFLSSVMRSIEVSFLADTIANKHNLAHVFEWPETADSEPSSEPLFKIIKSGEGPIKYMSYEFLPSTELVPLPSARFGISASVLSKLNRHRFPMKAWVMESGQSVRIAPEDGGRLFIPTEDSPKGYVMTKQATTVNPGGVRATGAFYEWWTAWFESRGQEIVDEKSELEEVWIGAQSRTAIREATTKKFARGSKASIDYTTMARKQAKGEFLADSARRH